MSAGIVYLSFGPNYVDCTIAALQSKVRNAPKTPAMVITNRKEDLNSSFCKQNNIQLKYCDIESRLVRTVKTQLYKYSPFEYTLALDADCWINHELINEFKVLDFTPMALAHAFHHPSIGTAAHTGAADREYTVKAFGGLRYVPQYASGLIFFRRDDPHVHQLYDTWYSEWQRFSNKDQLALIRAIMITKLFPLVLARKNWLNEKQGIGFVSHSFGQALPSMPLKDRRSPRRYTCLP